MKRYELSKCGAKWGVYDNQSLGWAGMFPSWDSADTWAEMMNTRADILSVDENMGDECWMLKQQA